MRLITISLSCLLLTACASSGFQQYYKPIVDTRTLTEVQLLEPGETPKIFSSNDLQRDVKVAISRGYRPVGQSSFNGEIESEKALMKQAQSVGAVLVLINSKFTENRKITTPVFVPNNQTTYSSGSVYGTSGSAMYSGTSTTYSSTVVPITTHQERYNQTAVYFVKSTRKLKVGLFLIDLPPDLRIKIEQNTGALIDVVAENSPAFVANVLPGDILVEINGTKILSVKHADDVIRATNPTDGKCTLKVIRNGTERQIELQLKQS